VIGEDTTNGLGRNRVDHSGADQLASQFRAIPLGETASTLVWQLAGEFNDVEGDLRGKTPVFVPAAADPKDRSSLLLDIGAATCARGAPRVRRRGRHQRSKSLAQTESRFGPGETDRQEHFDAVELRRERPVPMEAGQCGEQIFGPSLWFAPRVQAQKIKNITPRKCFIHT
jgi:hypothetical protein